MAHNLALNFLRIWLKKADSFSVNPKQFDIVTK